MAVVASTMDHLDRAGGLAVTDADRLAEIMQGFASAVRLRILAELRNQPRTVTELSEVLDVGQTTLSNHLRLLRHLRLVVGIRDGRHIHYELEDDHVADLLNAAIDHLAHVAQEPSR